MDSALCYLNKSYRPSQRQARDWLHKAVLLHGTEVVAGICGADRAGVWQWRKGRGRITTSAARWFWLLATQPKIESAFDLLTWGRFIKPSCGVTSDKTGQKDTSRKRAKGYKAIKPNEIKGETNSNAQ